MSTASKLLLFLSIGAGMLAIGRFTGYSSDSGDSYNHYLIAHFASKHPDLLLNHWGKPIFTLLAMPFYAFGFHYHTFFNIIITLLSAVLLFKIADDFKSQNAKAFVLIAFYASPQVFFHQFSAFTEPLFGFILLSTVFLIYKNSLITAALIASLLPFIRSEGFVLLPVFLAYFALRRQPLAVVLLFGTFFIYSLAGYFYFGDFWWYFSKNPYDRPSYHYGSGPWSHFFEHYPTVCGYPLAALMLVGIVRRWFIWINFIRDSKFASLRSDFMLPVHALFFAYFLAHVVFWRFGLFSSFGLLRVMTAIAGLGALMALDGAFALSRLMPSRQKIAWVGIIGLIAIWPFTENNTGFQLPLSIQKPRHEASFHNLKTWFSQQQPTDAIIFYSHPFTPIALGFDPFDEVNSRKLDHLGIYDLPKGSLLIWDEWYAQYEYGITLEQLNANPALDRMIIIGKQGEEAYGLAVFRVKQAI